MSITIQHLQLFQMLEGQTVFQPSIKDDGIFIPDEIDVFDFSPKINEKGSVYQQYKQFGILRFPSRPNPNWGIPDQYKSSTFRQISIVQRGTLKSDSLTFALSNYFVELVRVVFEIETIDNEFTKILLSKPIKQKADRKRAVHQTVEEIAHCSIRLLWVRACIKAAEFRRDRHQYPSKDEVFGRSLSHMFPKESQDWLKSLSVTRYGKYNSPIDKSSSEIGQVYVRGSSSLPSPSKVKRTSKAVSHQLMARAIDEIEGTHPIFLPSEIKRMEREKDRLRKEIGTWLICEEETSQKIEIKFKGIDMVVFVERDAPTTI